MFNTCNFDYPTSEPHKITDFSAAYFATGNVAIARKWLEKVGVFDTRFQLYGWEDLELGVRLKKIGLKLIKCPEAVGYHWHPSFNLDQIPELIDKEIQRGKMGILFYQKHVFSSKTCFSIKSDFFKRPKVFGKTCFFMNNMLFIKNM